MYANTLPSNETSSTAAISGVTQFRLRPRPVIGTTFVRSSLRGFRSDVSDSACEALDARLPTAAPAAADDADEALDAECELRFYGSPSIVPLSAGSALSLSSAKTFDRIRDFIPAGGSAGSER